MIVLVYIIREQTHKGQTKVYRPNFGTHFLWRSRAGVNKVVSRKEK